MDLHASRIFVIKAFYFTALQFNRPVIDSDNDGGGFDARDDARGWKKTKSDAWIIFHINSVSYSPKRKIKEIKIIKITVVNYCSLWKARHERDEDGKTKQQKNANVCQPPSLCKIKATTNPKQEFINKHWRSRVPCTLPWNSHVCATLFSWPLKDGLVWNCNLGNIEAPCSQRARCGKCIRGF